MDFKIDVGYKSKILYRDVKIDFPKNGIISIIGDNGSGKSTLYKTLVGSIPSLSGSVPKEFSKKCAIVSDYVHIPEYTLKILWTFLITLLKSKKMMKC